MYLGHLALKAVFRLMDDVQKESPQDLRPAYPPAPSLTIYDFFFFFIVADPALYIIKNTEAFIDVARRGQLQRISAKYKLIVRCLYRLHSHNTGQKHAVAVTIVEQRIVYLILLQGKNSRHAPSLLHVCRVQIDSRRCIDGTEIDCHRER